MVYLDRDYKNSNRIKNKSLPEWVDLPPDFGNIKNPDNHNNEDGWSSESTKNNEPQIDMEIIEKAIVDVFNAKK